MNVYFTKNDDFVLIHSSNMFKLLLIKMLKISFEIIRHHCFALLTWRNLHTCISFCVNVRLNKNKNPCTKKLEDRF